MMGSLGSAKTRIAYGLAGKIQPTHFATINFKIDRQIENDFGGFSRIPGDDCIYQNAADAILRSASKAIVPSSVWRRHKPLIVSAYAIEGGRRDGFKEVRHRPHVHYAVRAPDHLTPEKFADLFQKAARGNPWVLYGDSTVEIEPCENPAAAISYFLKEGTSRFMIAGTGSLDAAPSRR